MATSLRRPRRIRRTREQIQALLEDYQRSGRSGQQFADEHGIGLSTLWGWRRGHSTKRTSSASRWVEVQNPLPPALPGAMAHLRWPDGLVLEIHRGLEVEAIAQLVQKLRRG